MSAARLSERDPRAVAPWAVFSWTLQHVVHFFFIHVMVVNMRQSCFWINIKTKVHGVSNIEIILSGCKSKAVICTREKTK